MLALKNILSLLMFATILSGCTSKSDSKPILSKNQIIACIGDSTTHGQKHGYVEFLQKYVNEHHIDLNVTFLNWGRGAETITALTEKQYEIEYKGERPYLFNRLDQKLENAKQKPNIALFCYGINCGVSGAPSKELFDKYKAGVVTFLDKMEKLKIKVILMTPPPFSLEVAKANGWTPTSSEKYSWRNPYVNYDKEVVQAFRDIILETKHPAVLKIIDIHTVLKARAAECYGKDPIHPNLKGYELMGETLVKQLNCPILK